MSAHQGPQTDNFMTLVGVSEVPGKAQLRLPSIATEIEKIKDIVGYERMGILFNKSATTHQVLQSIQSSTWLHISCHGHQHATDPLKSSLILTDGQLELHQILEAHLPNAEFVFLSACDTAKGDAKLANESMHLAGCFIAAGFKGAIGTMWSMADSDGPEVAELVYKKIFEVSDEKPDATKAAEALHLAVEHLRKKGVPYHRWVPFIHMGI